MTVPAEKKCPYCKEMIKAEAIKCRFCGEFLEDPKQPVTPAAQATGPQAVPQPQQAQAQPQAQGQGLPAHEEPLDSETIFEGPLSKIDLVKPSLKLACWIVVAVGMSIGVSYIPQEFVKKVPWPYTMHALFGACILVALIGIAIFTYRYFLFKSRFYNITNDRIEYHVGLLSKQVDNIDMWRVNDLQFRQSFIHRLLGVGTVFVESNDSSHPYLLIGPVPQAKKLYERLRQAVLEADRRRGVLHVEH